MKEDLIEIKGEIRKLNHKLMDDNIRRDSLILECIENSSVNPIVKNGNRKNTSDVADDSVKDETLGLLSESTCVEPLPQMPDENLSLSDPYWQREVQDFGGAPSAPSFRDVASSGMENVAKSQNETVKFSLRNKNEIKVRNPTISENFKGGASSSDEIRPDMTVKDNNKGNSVSVVDDEGYQLVKKKKRPANIVGSKRTKDNETITGATKVADIYLGNCDLDVTPESISGYIYKETNIVVNKCEPLVSRNKNCTSFKVNVKLNDRQKLLSAEVWPEGIVCRKFYSARRQ